MTGDEPLRVPIEFEIDGKPIGSGDIRISEYLHTMTQLAKLFAEADAQSSPARQLEIIAYAVGATQEFIECALPGVADAAAPLAHLRGALIATAEGHRVSLFSVSKVTPGRDFLRTMLEAKACAAVDVLHGAPLNLTTKKAAEYVARVLESGGVKFSTKGGPAYQQLLEWRKRLRKLPAGNSAHENYHATIRNTRAQITADTDIKAGIKRQLKGLLVTITAAHINKAESNKT